MMLLLVILILSIIIFYLLNLEFNGDWPSESAIRRQKEANRKEKLVSFSHSMTDSEKQKRSKKK